MRYRGPMLKVLLADTDEHVLEVIQLYLVELDQNISVMSVLTGNHAAQALEDRQFDFAIFEVALPEVSGFELARRAADRNLPVLLMAAGLEGQAALSQFVSPRVENLFFMESFFAETALLLSPPADNLWRVRAALRGMRAE